MLQVVINPLLRTSGGEEHYAFNSVLAQLIFGGASFLSPLVYSYLVTNLNNNNKGLSVFRSIVPANLPWISLYWLFAVICLLMIAGLGIDNCLRLGVWLILGFFIYFGYSRKNSKAQKGEQ